MRVRVRVRATVEGARRVIGTRWIEVRRTEWTMLDGLSSSKIEIEIENENDNDNDIPGANS